MNRNLGRRWVALCALLLGVPACADRITHPEQVLASVAEVDGEAMFRGIFLGHGPVADAIPVIRDHLRLEYLLPHEDQVREVMRFADLLVERMADDDPTFFATFEASVRSGDHLRIQSALQEASGRLVETARGMTASSYTASSPEGRERISAALEGRLAGLGEDAAAALALASDQDGRNPGQPYEGGDVRPQACGFWLCVYAAGLIVYVAAFVDIAVVANVWEAIGVVDYAVGITNTNWDQDLFAERLVNSLAVNFASR